VTELRRRLAEQEQTRAFLAGEGTATEGLAAGTAELEAQLAALLAGKIHRPPIGVSSGTARPSQKNSWPTLWISGSATPAAAGSAGNPLVLGSPAGSAGDPILLASPSEKDANLPQKLGQLQPFLAVFLHEYMGQLAHLGQPNTLLDPAAPAPLAPVPEAEWVALPVADRGQRLARLRARTLALGGQEQGRSSHGRHCHSDRKRR
jgi:hypothetical protein